jgi:hypothetical protein
MKVLIFFAVMLVITVLMIVFSTKQETPGDN